MFDPLVNELSERYGLGDRGRDLFGLLLAYIHNDRRGGFGGFIEAFREQGHGELLSSWIGNEGAGGLNASDVGTVFGQGLLNDWGTRLGVSRATVAAAIAGVLPRLVAELTPGGRIPGGFGASAAPAGDRPGLRAGDDASSYSVRPGVDGLIDERDRRWGPPVDELDPAVPAEPSPSSDGPVYFDPPRFDPPPAEPRVSEPVSQTMRREPSFVQESAAVRTPVDARREHESAARAAPPLDPAEQRLADMAAAFDRGPRDGAMDPASAFDVRGERPPGWRTAVHPPRRERRGSGWFWLLLLLIVGAGGYAWSQGMLDPYIQQINPYLQQFNVMLPTPAEAGLR